MSAIKVPEKEQQAKTRRDECQVIECKALDEHFRITSDVKIAKQVNVACAVKKQFCIYTISRVNISERLKTKQKRQEYT